jgi:hypothetical protein
LLHVIANEPATILVGACTHTLHFQKPMRCWLQGKLPFADDWRSTYGTSITVPARPRHNRVQWFIRWIIMEARELGARW